eukprot:TRINITY_DN3134_c0_g1_i1.p1 TRINITY_DN3134_c0_g1~~TRINITY_DN3134_c0_g1_i1.p1  ORF type:complete len:270 (-),score=12.88 TRINITY_DN3134_c0_g1_i1:95-904(-)
MAGLWTLNCSNLKQNNNLMAITCGKTALPCLGTSHFTSEADQKSIYPPWKHSKAGCAVTRCGTHAKLAELPGHSQVGEARQCQNKLFTALSVLSEDMGRTKQLSQSPPATRRRLMCAIVIGSALLRPGGEGEAHAAVSPENCAQCGGQGVVQCGLCQGSGRWLVAVRNGFQVLDECPQCIGTGKLKCIRCLGTGLGNTAGLLRGPAVKEGKLRVRPDGSIEILDCDFFPATRGKQCRSPDSSEDTNLITEERANTAPRGQLYPRPDTVT